MRLPHQRQQNWKKTNLVSAIAITWCLFPVEPPNNGVASKKGPSKERVPLQGHLILPHTNTFVY